MNARKNRLGVCCLKRSKIVKSRLNDDLENKISKLNRLTLGEDQNDNVLINEDILSDLFNEEEQENEEVIEELANVDDIISINEVSSNEDESSPIVIINIKGDKIGLDEEKRSSGRAPSKVTREPTLNIDENLLKDLEERVRSMLNTKETGVKEDLDFDTDYITITMDEPPVPRSYGHFYGNVERRPYYQRLINPYHEHKYYHRRYPYYG